MSGETIVDQLVNLRDLGGLPTSDGRLTRAGVLYRSEAPLHGDRPPSNGLAWPPRTVVDLRSPVEQDGPHPLTSEATDIHLVPLLGDVDPHDPTSQTTTALAGGLRTLYQSIIVSAGSLVVNILHLAARTPAPLLVHCAAGKDRTGLVVAVLLRAAGVRADAVLADYAITATNMPAVLRRMGDSPLLPGGGRNARDLARTSSSAVEQVLGVIDGHGGGVAGWLADNGADPDAVSAWKSRLLS
ncbi:tyrosine-protein phosphatase [Protofrankia coriariae]|uniref:Protein tyrosine phosphatase n=1 Tax=Protofrankia coriariae TaxID=1562887 RepID=A0ABR5F5M1_9ACTN|nr:tyrosine-protein phosphatase [Protofrankia coriariae]KLL11968.1 protein tyrosine phosphatase [Protofrankia coriariae]